MYEHCHLHTRNSYHELMAYCVLSRLLKPFSVSTFSILHNVNLALFYGILFLPKEIMIVGCLIVLETTPKRFYIHEAVESSQKCSEVSITAIPFYTH